MALKRFVIEREIAKVGSLDSSQYGEAAAKSNKVLRELGSQIQWLHSYVAADKLFCIYLAANEEIIRRHAELSGFPATRITPIKRVIDPTTENAAVVRAALAAAV